MPWKIFWRLLRHLFLRCDFISSSQPSSSLRLDIDLFVLVVINRADSLNRCLYIWMQWNVARMTVTVQRIAKCTL